MERITLKEWSFAAGDFVEVVYDAAPVAEFINWFRRSKQWHEDPEMVQDKLRRLLAALTRAPDQSPIPNLQVAYREFVKDQRADGKTLAEIGKLWREVEKPRLLAGV